MSVLNRNSMNINSTKGVADLVIEEERVSALEALRGDAPDSLLLVCSYTDNEILAHIPEGEHGEGIYAWRLCGSTGKLSPAPTAVSRITPNPAFLVKHSTLDVLYTSTECIHAPGCGEIVTLGLSADNDGEVRELGRTSAGGRSTCYLNLHKSGTVMAAVNYWDSIVSLLPVSPEDGVVGPAPCHAHMQPGAEYVFEHNPDRVEHWAHRQRWPHTHCFVTAPEYGENSQEEEKEEEEEEEWTLCGRGVKEGEEEEGEAKGEEQEESLHLVPDLGQDTIWAYRVVQEKACANSSGGGVERPSSRLELVAGAKLMPLQGPRHLVFHPRCRTAYVINELKSTVSVLHFHPERLAATVAKKGKKGRGREHGEKATGDGEEAAQVPMYSAFESPSPPPSSFCSAASGNATFQSAVDGENPFASLLPSHESFLVHAATLRTLPRDFESGEDHHRSHASEIRLHPSGKWLLIANRGHDSIAVYSIDEEKRGALSLAHIIPSGGLFPRNFNFDASGHWVIVGNQNSNNLTVFSFDHAGSGAMAIVDVKHQPSPNYVFSLPTPVAVAPVTTTTTVAPAMPLYPMAVPPLKSVGKQMTETGCLRGGSSCLFPTKAVAACGEIPLGARSSSLNAAEAVAVCCSANKTKFDGCNMENVQAQARMRIFTEAPPQVCAIKKGGVSVRS